MVNLEDSGGGWAIIIFHELCPDACEHSSTTPEIFQGFMDWLAPRAASNGTEVKTIKQVIQGPPEARAPVDTTDPVSQVACDGGACSGGFYDHTVDVSLSATDAGGSGLNEIRYTTDGSNPTGGSPAYSGAITVATTTTIRFRAEDNAGNVESPDKAQSVQVQIPEPPPPPPQGGEPPAVAPGPAPAKCKKGCGKRKKQRRAG